MMPFALRSKRSIFLPRTSSFSARGVAALAVFVLASVAIAPAHAQTPSTQWISGTATLGAWSNAANWDNGVPNSGKNAIITSSGATISLGSGAAANSLFVQGPVGGESQLSAGDLTLADQLWIDVAAPGTILRLYDGGSAPVSVTSSKVTLGANLGNQGNIILDSQSGGSVALAVTDTLTIGYDGSGSYVYTYPFIGTAAGSASITAGTIQTSGLSTAGATDYNYIGTYHAGHTVTATNLNLGIAGIKGGADNYGGNWTITNTALGDQSTSGGNYLTITDSGTFTNSGAFTVGVRGSGNHVYVGYADDAFATINGTLRLTGPNDLVIGSGSTANQNAVTVDHASTLSASGNIVIGIDGHGNSLVVDQGSTVTSGGARLGVNADSSSNIVTVSGSSSWTINGTVRVGDKGSQNEFYITSGGTVTLTGTGKNFYVGYDKSASLNALAVTGTGSTLSVKATGADLVVSANVTGTTGDSSLNVIAVTDGGVIDANRTLIGNGGQIWGDNGTIKGDTLVGTGGVIAPGVPNVAIGSLSFVGNVDLTNGGTLAIELGPGGTADFIDVSGTLSIGGSTLALTVPFGDTGLVYTIARYGTLSGLFGSITGLPNGNWFVDYNYQGLNEIAIVSQVPEIDPGSFASVLALIAGSLALVERRSLRRSARSAA
jgi:hypothetical protein